MSGGGMSTASTSLTYNHDYNSGGGGGEGAELAQEATAAGGGATPAGFALFSSDKKNEDLKQMLESNKDSSKLEAMKRIVGMISAGKNASELFPAVVKNVASKNLEERASLSEWRWSGRRSPPPIHNKQAVIRT